MDIAKFYIYINMHLLVVTIASNGKKKEQIFIYQSQEKE